MYLNDLQTAKYILAYAYGDQTSRSRKQTPNVSQERIRKLLLDAVEVGGYLMGAIPKGGRWLGREGFNELRSRTEKLNKQFARYTQTISVELVITSPRANLAALKDEELVNFVERPTATKECPPIEGHFAYLIFELCENAAILHFYPCSREGCQRLTFSRRSPWNVEERVFCGDSCRSAARPKSSYGNELRAAKARAEYQHLKAADAQIRGDAAAASKHTANARAAEIKITALESQSKTAKRQLRSD